MFAMLAMGWLVKKDTSNRISRSSQCIRSKANVKICMDVQLQMWLQTKCERVSSHIWLSPLLHLLLNLMECLFLVSVTFAWPSWQLWSWRKKRFIVYGGPVTCWQVTLAQVMAILDLCERVFNSLFTWMLSVIKKAKYSVKYSQSHKFVTLWKQRSLHFCTIQSCADNEHNSWDSNKWTCDFNIECNSCRRNKRSIW